MPTTYYTQERKKAGVIEYCPKCKKKGRIRRYVKIDEYTHSEEYRLSSIFRHIQSQEQCIVPRKDREDYHRYVSVSVEDCIGKIPSELSYKIVKAHTNGVREDQVVLDILYPYIERTTKRVKAMQSDLNRAHAIVDSIQQDSCAS